MRRVVERARRACQERSRPEAADLRVGRQAEARAQLVDNRSRRRGVDVLGARGQGDADRRVRDAQPLGRDRPGELGALAYDELRSPLLDERERAGKRGPRVTAREHLSQHMVVLPLEWQREHGQPRRLEHVLGRLRQRPVREPRPLRLSRDLRGSCDEHLMAGPHARMRRTGRADRSGRRRGWW